MESLIALILATATWLDERAYRFLQMREEAKKEAISEALMFCCDALDYLTRSGRRLPRYQDYHRSVAPFGEEHVRRNQNNINKITKYLAEWDCRTDRLDLSGKTEIRDCYFSVVASRLLDARNTSKDLESVGELYERAPELTLAEGAQEQFQ